MKTILVMAKYECLHPEWPIRLSVVLFMLFTTTICVLSVFLGVAFADDFQKIPLNPDYINYLNGQMPYQSAEAPVGPDIHPLGLIPSSIDRSYMTGIHITPPLEHLMRAGLVQGPIRPSAEMSAPDLLTSFPSRYDLRTLGRVSPVKNQLSCGSCWAFAAMGSLESDLSTQAMYDFSEHNLMDLSGFGGGPCVGGAASTATAYFARWDGPVNETDDPYSDTYLFSPIGLPVQKHIQDVQYIPDRAGPLDNNNIKVAVQTYGGLYTTMYMDQSGSSFNTSTSAYYYYGTSGYGDHAVTIVGWDDNYPASNFKYAPPGNGAFIVKNSWGTSWGDSGYFYASYYDQYFGKGSVAFYDAESTSNYGTVYEYDPLGEFSLFSFFSGSQLSPTIWTANIFTAVDSHNITAAGFYTENTNTTYTVYVYNNVTDSPTSGTLAETVSGSLPYAGYHTVNLTSPVPVTQGQKFSIVVEVSTTDGSAAVTSLSDSRGTTIIMEGQSLVGADGVSWADATTFEADANSSVSVKAYSDGSHIAPAPLCILQLSAYWSPTYVDGSGGTGSVNVVVPDGCPWTITTVPSWVTITSPMSGSGNGTVTFNVEKNPTPAFRYDFFHVGVEMYQINQLGDFSSCTYSISPTSSGTLSGALGFYSYSVTTQPNCQTTPVSSQPSWLQPVSGPVNGSGTVTYRVQPNSGVARTGTITIGDQVFTVKQAALGTCTAAINPTSNMSMPYGGGATSISVTTQTGCAWTADSSFSWATISSGQSGTGNGTVTISVAPNLGTGRTGTLNIAGQTFNIGQNATPCTYSINPTSNVSAAGIGGTISVAVITQPGCTWTTADAVSWAPISSGSSGTGSGRVNINVTPNPSGAATRSGVMTIAGQTFNIGQNPVACTYSINPTASGSLNYSRYFGYVTVSTPDGCAWSVTNPLSWVILIPPASEIGNGTVMYLASVNDTGSVRSGSMTIAGQEYDISQQAAPCTYTLSSYASAPLNYAGATGSFNVITSSTCSWSVSSVPAFATITAGASGTGNGTVSYSITANPNTATRSAGIVASGQTYTVSQQGAPCTYSINPTANTSISGSGGTTSVSVTTQDGCSWTTSDALSWAPISSGATGTGNGTVSINVAPNPSGVATRSGIITIAGQAFSIGQNPVPCIYSINPASNGNISYTGATGSVSVTSPVDCAWSVTNALPWITVTSSASGTGSGTVTYTAAASAVTSVRSGSMTIAGQTYSVSQQAAPCTYSLDSYASAPLNSAVDTVVFAVITSSNCAWDVSSVPSWITITAGASGTGSGTVSYYVATNPNSTTRSAGMTVGGQTYTVSQQAAPCTYSINPTTSASLNYSGDNASVSVTAPGGCAWNVTGVPAWTTITSGSSGTGNGTVAYSVSANNIISARNASMTIAGRAYSISQQALPCTYSINPSASGALSGASASAVSISVTAPAGCSWTVTDTLDWATLTSGTSGSGNGTVNVSVAQNYIATPRAGTITVAGNTYTLSQNAGGVPANCTYSLNSTKTVLLAKGGASGSFGVTTQTGCQWSVSNPTWMTITSGSSGAGSGTVQYSVASNASPLRSGTLTVADQTLKVLQGTTSTHAQIGVFRSGAWYVDRDESFGWSECGTDGCYAFGMAGDQAVAGDWDGNGIVRLGVFRNGTWYLDYNGDSQWSGCGTTADTDRCYSYGQSDDIPVVGDWSGDGKAKIGVFRNGKWYLDYKGDGQWVGCGTTADTSRCYTFGQAGDIPVVGDWNGDGKTKVGVFRNGNWYLDYNGDGQWSNCGTTPGSDRCYTYGMAGDTPVVGDWSGNGGVSKIGVFRNGTWYLDYKGTNTWVGCGAPVDGSKDACMPFGMSGDTPLVFR